MRIGKLCANRVQRRQRDKNIADVPDPVCDNPSNGQPNPQ
jgi:hypothetical protein